MKILVIDGRPDAHDRLAAAMAARGHDVTWWTDTRPAPGAAAGTHHVLVPPDPHLEDSNPALGPLRSIHSYSVRVARMLEAVEPTPHVVIHDAPSGAGMLLRSHCHAPAVARFQHTGAAPRLARFVGRPPETALRAHCLLEGAFGASVSHSVAIVTHSQHARARCPAPWRDGVEVVPAPCPRRAAPALLPKLRGRRKGTPLIALAAPTLEAIWGIDLALDAITRVAATSGPIDVVLMGRPEVVLGPEIERRNPLRRFNEAAQRAARAGVSLIRTGYAEHATRSAMFTGADAVVFASVDAPSLEPLLEAMTVGATIVASDRSEASEYVTDGVEALLGDPLQTDPFAARIARVLDDRALAAALGTAAAVAASRFPVSTCLDRWEELLERVRAQVEPRKPRRDRTSILGPIKP